MWRYVAVVLFGWGSLLGCALLAKEAVKREPAAMPTGSFQVQFVPDVIRPSGEKAALFACYSEVGEPGALTCMDFKSFLEYAREHSGDGVAESHDL